MPFTVDFATGESVDFQNQPTPQDIDEVATKMGINKPLNQSVSTEPPSKGLFDTTPYDSNAGALSNALSFAGNVVKDIPTGFNDLGKIPSEIGGLYKDTGNSLLKTAGYGLMETGRTLGSAVSGIGNIVGGGVSALGNKFTGRSILPQAEEAGTNALEGMAQGAFQRPVSTEVGLDILGPKGTSIIKEVGRPIIDTTKKIIGGVSRPVLGSPEGIIGDTIRKTANKYIRPSGILSDSENINKTNPIGVISSYGKKAMPIVEHGKIIPDNAIDFLDSQIGRLSEIRNDAVFLNENTVPTSGFLKYANDLIDSQKNWTEMRIMQTKVQVKKIFEDIKDAYKGKPIAKDGLPIPEIGKIKTEQTGLSKSYKNPGQQSFQYDAHGIVGRAAKDLVEMFTDDAPTQELNKLIQSHYDAIDLLDSLRGRTPHGGMLSRHFNTFAGEVTGLGIGMTVGHPFIGAMGGRVASGALSDLLSGSLISNPLKSLIVNNSSMGETPAVVGKMTKYINENSPDISELGNQSLLRRRTPNISAQNMAAKPTGPAITYPAIRANIKNNKAISSRLPQSLKKGNPPLLAKKIK